MNDLLEVNRVLVIAPKRVAEDTWIREHDKWDHLKGLKVVSVLGNARARCKSLSEKADIYVISRDNTQWLVELYGKKWPFDMVVIDELSSFKNPQAKRFKALRKVRPLIDRIVGLTGTPSPNGLLDLWAQMYLIDRGERLERTIGAYRQKYFTQGAHSGYVVYEWKPKPGAHEAINAKLSDVCVSMKADDYISLPKRIDNIVPVRLTDAEYQVYKELESTQLIELSGQDVVAASAAAVMNKLLQMANGAVYANDGQVVHFSDSKLSVLQEIVEASQSPVLVFYSFKHDCERIRALMPYARLVEGPGSIRDWNDGNIKLLLAHPASVGYGLNLQEGGSTICWYGCPWSLEWYMQANARLQRQGQRNTVIIHHLVTEHTIDEQVIRALQKKDIGQQALMNALKERGYDEG